MSHDSDHYRLDVNGEVRDVADSWLGESLLDVLRDRLGLTGAKEGCGTGDCGSCSVAMDGRLVCSCLVLGAEAEGREIGTIEGMSKGEDLHPLQEKYVAVFWEARQVQRSEHPGPATQYRRKPSHAPTVDDSY